MFSRRFVLDKLKLLATRSAVQRFVQDGGNQSPVANTVNSDRIRYSIDVTQFGADPTGQRDSSSAIAEAVAECFNTYSRQRPRPLFFPPGTFLIHRHNIFRSPAMTEAVLAWSIYGAGRTTTTLVFQPKAEAATSDYYLYDGMSDDNSSRTLLGLSLSDLSIKVECSQLASPVQVHCFRQFGSGKSSAPEQSWTFTNCGFEGDEAHADCMGSVLEIAGDANGSENSFFNSRGLAFRHAIDCRNPQAVNHLCLHCHWEAMTGDIFRFIRGGNLSVYGGSLILDNFGHVSQWQSGTKFDAGAKVYCDGRPFQTQSGGMSGSIAIDANVSKHFDGGITWDRLEDESMFVLRVGGDLSGQINSFVISGSRIELRTNRAKLMGGGDLNTAALVIFDAVAVQPVLGGQRHTIEIAESSLAINFRNCRIARVAETWDEPFAVAFGPAPDEAYPERARGGAQISLDGCQVSENIHGLSSWATGSLGSIALRGCRIAFRDAHQPTGQSNTTIVNATVTAPSLSRHLQLEAGDRHRHQTFISFTHWPHQTAVDAAANDDIFISLPPKAVVETISFVKRSLGGNAKEYYLRLVDLQNGSILYSSPKIDFGSSFEITTSTLNLSSNSAPLRLAIRGIGSLADEAHAGADDFIKLDWV